MHRIRYKKLLLMLYILRSFLVSPSWYLCKKVHVFTYVVSAEVGSLFLSQTLYTYIHIYMLWNIHAVWINESRCAIFVLACYGWIQVQSVLTWLLIALWGTETMPFAWCVWDFDIFLVASSRSPTPRDRSISITSRIQWKLLIHTYG